MGGGGTLPRTAHRKELLSPTETPAQAARIISTAEFHAAVHAALNHPAPRVAVFDCDGTLWSGDAGSGFMHWTVQRAAEGNDQGILSPEAIAWLDQRYRGYLAGQVSELDICGQMVQVYRGLRESDMRAAAAEFFATRIEPDIFPEMLALIRDLQAAGTEIWAVSSTCDWVIEEGVRRFSIPASRVLAARVAIANGIVTDTLLDVPTDESKVAALARAGITAPGAVFGNSVHDAAMLAIARSHKAINGASGAKGISGTKGISETKAASGAFPVNPTPALLQRAAHEGWPVFYPASVRPAGAP